MSSARPLATLLISASFITSTIAAPISAAHAQGVQTTTVVVDAATEGRRVLLQNVRAAVRANPALADGVGTDALLEGVRQATSKHPLLSDAIIDTAISIQPAQAPLIRQAAQTGLATGQTAIATTPTPSAPVPPVETVSAPPPPAPAPNPAVATATSGLGGGVITGLAGLAAVGAVVGGVAVAAGGGSGDDKYVPPPPPPPSVADTVEFQNQYGLAAINADAANDRGATGEGVIVAVINSGLEIAHPDIDDNIQPGGINYFNDQPSVVDDGFAGQGTTIAGIIAAERGDNGLDGNIQGVAYDAKILPLRIIGEDPEDESVATWSYSDFAEASAYAVTQGVKVISNSYSPDLTYADPDDEETPTSVIIRSQLYDGIKVAADAGVIQVFANGDIYDDNIILAGNPIAGGLYPFVRPENADSGAYDDGGANLDYSDIQDMIVTVAATNEAGFITASSNRCGVAAEWCISAPGENIATLSDDFSNGPAYTIMSGNTSAYASAHVSGALAVLIDIFPELTPQEIIQRMFVSANKTGVYANEEVYGQGFLDLEKATRPIGSLSISTESSAYRGASYALAATSMHVGPAFGDSLAHSLSGQKLAVFDDQKATFYVDMGQMARLSDAAGIDLEQSLRRFRSRFAAKEVAMGDAARLSYAVVDTGGHNSLRADPAVGDRNSYMELAYQQNFADTQVNMQYNVNPAAMYGIYQSKLANVNHMISRDAFSAPYLSFAKQGYSFGTATPLNEAFSLRVGAFHGYPLADELRATEDRAESFGQMVELAYKAGALNVFTQVGMLSEKQTFLGSRTQGAFDLDSGTHTSFAGLNGAYALSPQWSLVGSYYRGVSSPEIDSRSLFADISDVQTESFSVGMLGHDVLRLGDQIGLLGNQPLRVVDGQASLSLASGRTRSGMLYKQDYDVNLAPTGRELNMEAFYHVGMADTGTQVMSSMMYRTEPGHIENAPDEGVFLLQLQQPF